MAMSRKPEIRCDAANQLEMSGNVLFFIHSYLMHIMYRNNIARTHRREPNDALPDLTTMNEFYVITFITRGL